MSSQPNVLSTKNRILDVGTNLLSTKGFSGVSLGGLAQEAGMSKSGLFAHFRSKDALEISLLDQSTQLAQRTVVAPAMLAEEGLPRLRTLVARWLGWAQKAGLDGGCAVAAGLFELDDVAGPVRDHLQELEAYWRSFLSQLVRRTVELGQFRPDLDVNQFVFELFGIYLTHHAYARFLRDKAAAERAATAFEALVARALPVNAGTGRQRKNR